MQKLAYTLGMSILCWTSFANAKCNAMLTMHAPANSLMISYDNLTVIDSTTQLMWMRCPVGFALENETCVESELKPNHYNWRDALQIANDYEYAGFNDWTLPNRKELETLVNRQCFEPAIDESLFPAMAIQNFWTNSPHPFNKQFAWAIAFDFGGHKPLSKTDLHAVRLVRVNRQ